MCVRDRQHINGQHTLQLQLYSTTTKHSISDTHKSVQSIILQVQSASCAIRWCTVQHQKLPFTCATLRA